MTALPDIVFDVPWMLAVACVPPLLVWWLSAARTRQRQLRLSRFAEASALSRLLGKGPNTSSRTARLIAIVALAGAASAGPRWGLARGPATARGIDMAIAIDASLSMTAPDDKPSRLERVKQEVRRLRAMSHADRVALIAFAGRSYILTPLTTDDGAIELFLDNLDPSVVGQAGSSIARAVRQGTELLLASDGSADRALVLMSDGEAFEPAEDVESAAAEAGKKGVAIVTVGFGTTAGSTIPVSDGSGIHEKRDERGQVVITKYSPDLLERAAAASSGGTFIPAEASDKATRIRSALRSLRTARRKVESREDRVPRFLWLLVPALFLLLYDTWAMSRGTSRNGSGTEGLPPASLQFRNGIAPQGSLPTALLTMIVLGMGLPLGLVACAREPDPAVRFAEGDIAGAIAAYRAMVTRGDTSAATRYNLGSALLGADTLPESRELLEAVRRSADGEVRMRARFNAGLGSLRVGRAPNEPDAEQALGAARAAYRAYLGDRSDDLDAKWNYELALRPSPPSGGGGGGGGGGNDAQEPQEQRPQPQGGIDQRQAEALLNNAAREERDVQGRKQKQGRVPPRGKDW